MESLIEKIGGRKFVLSVLSIAAGVGLTATGKPLSMELTGLIVGVLAAFTGGNVMVSKAAINSGGKVAETATETSEPVAIPPVNDPQLVEAIARVEAKVDLISTTTANSNKLLMAAITGKQ